MAINKVNYKGETIIDLSTDTVEESSVKEGLSFHGADGEIKTGTFAPQEKEITENGEITPDEGKYLSKVIVNVSAGAGGGIVDVDALPIEGIDPNTFYRTKEERHKEPVLYVSMQGMAMPFDELLILMSQGEITEVNITYTVVTELPETMEPFDEATFTIPLYVLESNGMAYCSPTGSSSDAMTIGAMMGGIPEFGWIDDPSEINLDEMGMYTVRGENFTVYHYWNYANDSWTEFIATVDISELPTEGIELNTIYRLTEMGALNLYVAAQGTIMDYNAYAEQIGLTIVYNIVDELPEVGEGIVGTTATMYIIKDTGVVYMYEGEWIEAGSAMGVPNCGWISDPTTIVDDGAYMYAAPGVVRYFVFKDGEMVEYTSGSNEAQFIECLSNAELEHLILPEDITQIIPYACYGRGYKEITIPATVTNIGAYAFANCENLETIYFDGTASRWCNIVLGDNCFNGVCAIQCKDALIDQNGIIYNLNDDGTAYVVADVASEKIKVANIPSVFTGLPVMSIAKRAFDMCASLESVTIPNSIVSIGEYAFHGCNRLTDVYITDMSAWCNIKFGNDYAAPTRYANNLYLNGQIVTDVVVPDGVTSIGYSFCGYSKLKSIYLPNSITTINSSAFYNCTGLTTINIPDGVTAISYSTFSGCTSLRSIVLPDSVTTIGSYAFYKCYNLTRATIGSGVTDIGYQAFDSCYKLVEIYNYSPSIEVTAGKYSDSRLGYYALDVYTSASSTSKLWTNEDGYTFYENGDTCYLLGYTGYDTEMVLPASCNDKNYAIYKYAFSTCTDLMSVTINNSVISIGDEAFSGCIKLVEVYNYSSYFTVVAGERSNGCVGLHALDVYTAPEQSKIFTTEDGYTFYENQDGCCLLSYAGTNRELILPESYNGNEYYIGYHAFKDNTDLVSVTLSDGITSICSYAFYKCSRLRQLIMSSSVKSINANAFEGCELERVDITDLAAWCNIFFENEYSNPLRYRNTTNRSTMLYLNGEAISGDVIIPNGTTTICHSAFYYCEDITNVSIPNSVTSIGNGAFFACDGLTKVTIPGNVKSIGEEAFMWCDNLTELILQEGVESIGRSALQACDKISDIVIPSSVTSIHPEAFWGCNNLVITVSEENTAYYSMNRYLIETATSTLMFAGKNATDIPNGVLIIGSYSLSSADWLTNIVIPDSVTTIDKYAFYYSSNLTSITIGSGVTSIGYDAFTQCSKLTDIYYNGTKAQWRNKSFSSNLNSSSVGSYTVHCTDGDI